jgi:hypothetical protein
MPIRRKVKRSYFGPSVARIDNVHGDRYVFYSCPPVSIEQRNTLPGFFGTTPPATGRTPRCRER